MFLKTSEIKSLVIFTSMMTKNEYDFIKGSLSEFLVLFLIPFNEEKPSFLSACDKTVREEQFDRLFGYERLVKKIVNDLEEPSNNVVFISKSIDQLKCVLPQPVGTILVSSNDLDYEHTGFLPDIRLASFNDLRGINHRQGYFSEVNSTILSDGMAFNNSGLVLTFKMEREKYQFNVVAGGRYFNTKHENYNSHQLSHRINRSKQNNSQDKIFEGLFVPIINHINHSSTIHGITRVPNRPSKSDRLKPLVQSISNVTGLSDFSDRLVCLNEYPSHKSLSSDQRFKNVRDQFSVRGKFSGDHIIVIDDVFTTGATIFECARQLYSQGAGKVTAVVLGINQFTNEFAQPVLSCPQCSGKLQLKINSRTNTAFYGCQNYFNSKDQCIYSENFMDGWNRSKKENSFSPENDNGSDDLWLF